MAVEATTAAKDEAVRIRKMMEEEFLKTAPSVCDGVNGGPLPVTSLQC